MLVGLSDKQVQVRGHITQERIYGVALESMVIKVNYLIVDVLSPYNVILGRSVINALWAVISTQYLVLKYTLSNGRVRNVEETNKAPKSIT